MNVWGARNRPICINLPPCGKSKLIMPLGEIRLATASGKLFDLRQVHDEIAGIHAKPGETPGYLRKILTHLAPGGTAELIDRRNGKIASVKSALVPPSFTLFHHIRISARWQLDTQQS